MPIMNYSSNAGAGGDGNVVGPNGATAGGLAYYSGNSGLVLQDSPFTPVNYSLLGYNGSALPGNVTIGAGLSLSTGMVLSATATGSGDVSGPGSSTAGGLVFFNGTTGKIIENTPFSPVSLSLLGYNSSSVPFNVTIGANLALSSGGVLSATGGEGNVTGPGSSTAGELVLYADNTGKVLTNIGFTPSANTLLGYNNSTQVSSITIGTGLSLSGNVLSVIASGSGNVTGPDSSQDGGLVIFNGTTGKAIQGTTFSGSPNSLVGFDGSGDVANFPIGAGKLTVITGTLLQLIPVINTSSSQTATPSNNDAFYLMSSAGNVTVTLPASSAVSVGWRIQVCRASASNSVSIVAASGDLIGYLNTSNTPGLAGTVTVSNQHGVITITRTGQIGGATATPWNAYGNIQ